jgi:hypothetical protein
VTQHNKQDDPCGLPGLTHKRCTRASASTSWLLVSGWGLTSAGTSVKQRRSPSLAHEDAQQKWRNLVAATRKEATQGLILNTPLMAACAAQPEQLSTVKRGLLPSAHPQGVRLMSTVLGSTDLRAQGHHQRAWVLEVASDDLDAWDV